MVPVFLFRQTILKVLNVPAGTVTVSSPSTVTVSTRSLFWRSFGRSSDRVCSHDRPTDMGHLYNKGDGVYVLTITPSTVSRLDARSDFLEKISRAPDLST